MTKPELIETMAKDAGISKVAADAALKSIQNNIVAALQNKNGRISLAGFGTFLKSHRKARKGVNPRTGEPIDIKARNVIKFKPGKTLKNSI